MNDIQAGEKLAKEFDMRSMLAAKFIAYGTCVFLVPFWLAACFAPMSALSVGSIGLAPLDADLLTGLSNIRGTVGGLRLGLIAMMGLGAYYERPGLCLGAAITLGSVSAGRVVSLGLDGWNTLSFITAAAEAVMVLSMLHIGGYLGRTASEAGPAAHARAA